MEVKLLNPEQVKNLFKEWGYFACECYNTPKKFAERVGESCFDSGHFSGSRTEYIKFEISGVDRGVMEQSMRHEIGVRQNPINENTYDENPCNIVKNMQSFRYVDKSNYEYTTPPNIENVVEAKQEYDRIHDEINKSRIKIKDILIFNGIDEHEAIEDANYLLPRATNGALCIGFTIEALIHYMHKRLCTRSQYFHRKLAKLMKEEILKIIPSLKDVLVSECDYLLWCPEGKKCCGRRPTKDQLIERLNQVNNDGVIRGERAKELIELLNHKTNIKGE